MQFYIDPLPKTYVIQRPYRAQKKSYVNLQWNEIKKSMSLIKFLKGAPTPTPPDRHPPPVCDNDTNTAQRTEITQYASSSDYDDTAGLKRPLPWQTTCLEHVIESVTKDHLSWQTTFYGKRYGISWHFLVY